MNDVIECDCREVLRRVNLSQLSGKSVLITGANGFLGQSLICAIALANRQQKLGCMITAVGLHSPRGELKDLLSEDPSITYCQVDLSKPFVELQGFDLIFHAAGYAQPARFVDDAVSTIEINVNATRALLDGSPACTFIFFSSAEVYGDIPTAKLPVSEDYNGTCELHSPRSVYAESKHLGEALCAAYKRKHGTNIKIIRISAAYGPGLLSNDTRVMSDFIIKAIKFNKIELLDGGNSIRTYGYIADITAMILFVATASKEMIYNVGGRDKVSILELAKRIGAYLDVPVSVPQSASCLTHIGSDPKAVELDLVRIANEFKAPIMMSFEDGLARTIDWHRADLLKVNV